MAGTLYVVATPIGNLEDLTFRALRILKEVDLIAAEDTRHTKKLLAHYAITVPLTSYYDQIEVDKAPLLIAQLQAGKNIALVSDAGTPCIADPGYRLIKGAQAVGVRVVPIPGASMLTALLSVSGLPTDRFVFEGFLPAKPQQRRKALERLQSEERTLVLFESPHRLRDLLHDVRSLCGDRYVVIGRELTKVFEELLRGPVSEVLSQLQAREIKGEIGLLIAGRKPERVAADSPAVKEEIRQLLAAGLPLKELAQVVSERYRITKREIYALGLELKEET